MICFKWDCMLDMGWNTNTYSDVASLALCGTAEEDNLAVFAGNLVTSQIIVGDLRSRRRREDLEVATTLPGKAPLAVSEGLRLLSTLWRRGSSPQIPPRGRSPPAQR